MIEHNEFFIEKEQLPVEVIMVTGEVLCGSLFVQPTWRRPSIEFDAPVLLNLQEPYFPLQLSDGSTRLLAKGHVVLIRGNAAESDGSKEGLGEPAPVMIQCSNGTCVRGSLTITRMTSKMRVLDYLNHTAEEFIPLYQDDGTVLLNRRHIVVVLDESHGTD